MGGVSSDDKVGRIGASEGAKPALRGGMRKVWNGQKVARETTCLEAKKKPAKNSKVTHQPSDRKESDVGMYTGGKLDPLLRVQKKGSTNDREVNLQILRMGR